MDFLDREDELDRLRGLARAGRGGLAVVYGRRRVGKTRLLVEWIRSDGGIYWVADQSAPAVQRRWLAETVGRTFPGFSDVEYPDWKALLGRLAVEAERTGFRGPLVLDEFPWLAASSPELPGILQGWLDHEARRARLLVVLAGSSQRMMQGLVLSSSAPLYGRASEILEIRPLAPRWLRRVFPRATPPELAATWIAFGGVPRYWELLETARGDLRERIDRLVLDPLGPLHREPDHLLLEETPPALELRPILDAVGSGAHRTGEIAGRLGVPATSLARPLRRLVELGMLRRDVPFGESPRKGKRSLYRIADPFLRLWFRVVAPHRSTLEVADRRERLALLEKAFPGLAGEGWEDLCRLLVPSLDPRRTRLGALGPWGVPGRWWRGNDPEWDIVAADLAGNRLLLGEARWGSRPFSRQEVERFAAEVAARRPPLLPARYAERVVERALFVPAVRGPARAAHGVHVVTARHMLG